MMTDEQLQFFSDVRLNLEGVRRAIDEQMARIDHAMRVTLAAQATPATEELAPTVSTTRHTPELLAMYDDACTLMQAAIDQGFTPDMLAAIFNGTKEWTYTPCKGTSLVQTLQDHRRQALRRGLRHHSITNMAKLRIMRDTLRAMGVTTTQPTLLTTKKGK